MERDPDHSGGDRPGESTRTALQQPTTDSNDGLETPRRPSIFRQEFLRAYSERSDAGVVLKVAPSWIGAAYWVVLALALAALVYALAGRVPEYATGPAIIRYADRVDLTSLTDATVAEVLVGAGTPV